MAAKDNTGVAPVNLVRTTNDYGIFQHLPGNRHVNPKLVRQLMDSFREKPQLIYARPILLNESNQMVDGQHRFEALQRCEMKVPYMVVPGLTINDARLLNALQRSWSLADFAYSFAETEGGKFARFVELMEEYKMPPRSLLLYATGTEAGARVSADFRLGIYEPRSDKEMLNDLDRLTDYEPYNRFWNEQAFALAVYHLLYTEGYDHIRMMRKLAENGGMMQKRAGVRDYLRDLEEIYNRNVPRNNFVRFI